MFKGLHGLAKSTDLQLSITSQGDTLRVVVIPKAKEGANAALSTPLVLEATPQELDEKFAETLFKYTASRKSLEETLAETTAFMAAAGKDAKDAANKAAQPTGKKTGAPAPAQMVEPASEKASESTPGADPLTLF